MLGNYRKALEDAIQSIQLDEGFVKGYLRAAKCHLMLGNPRLSIQFYEKVLKLQPGNTQAKEEVCVCVCVCLLSYGYMYVCSIA